MVADCVTVGGIVLDKSNSETNLISSCPIPESLVLSCTEIPFVDVRASTHPFFQTALQKEFPSVSFFEIKIGTRSSHTAVVDRAFIVPSQAAAFVDADRAITQSNKETLTSLLELAEESHCSAVIACVNRSSGLFGEIVRSYLTVGFELINFVSLPGYVLLSQEL